MSPAERKLLQHILKNSPGTATRWKRGAENALVMFAVLMLLFFAAWWATSWLARVTLGQEIGLRGSAAGWVGSFGVLLCMIVAIISSIRWVRGWKDVRSSLNQDLQNGKVVEEHYRFTAAKRFQEPEHGGLVYFLRTTDDKVLVLYDEESQGLGVRGQEPLSSEFRSHADLVMVRAPRTGYVISKRFSGEILDAGEPRELVSAPEEWPEPDTYCAVPWHDLDAHFSASTQKRRTQHMP